MQDSTTALAMDAYTSSVPAFLTKLWTLVEDPETNHLICWNTNGTSFHVFDQSQFAKEVLPKYFKHNNMASFVSVVKSEETKMRQEDLSRLLYEIQVLRNQQEMMEQNEVLWKEVLCLRQNHLQHQKVINKLIQFLFGQLQSSPNSPGIKRKRPLMLDDGNSAPQVAKFRRPLPLDPFHEPCYIQPEEAAGPDRKAAFTSPAVPLVGYNPCPEPPVLPITVVQSVLDGRTRCDDLQPMCLQPQERRSLLDSRFMSNEEYIFDLILRMTHSPRKQTHILKMNHFKNFPQVYFYWLFLCDSVAYDFGISLILLGDDWLKYLPPLILDLSSSVPKESIILKSISWHFLGCQVL
ncbi:hypothetical protein E2320_001050 [Naja naja]|nr:hypothetical protein E2320_001050 [Naja naja]